MHELVTCAARVAVLLRKRQETVAVAESSAGGLISAALLAVPGASDYYIGGTVIYTGKAWYSLREFNKELLGGFRSFAGPIIGAIVFNYLKTYAVGYTVYWQLLLGAVLVGLVLSLPTGIVGTAGRLVARLQGRQ